MSESLIFDEKKYMSATVAGKYFGYTKDYMLMLAKQGKIDGKKIGHKWFIYLPSAEAYFISAKYDREVRRRELSDSRKRELEARVAEVVKVEKERQEIIARKLSHTRVALLETLVIVFLGISVGSFGYLGSTNPASLVQTENQSVFKTLAISVYNFFTGVETEDRKEPYVSQNVLVSELGQGESSVSMHLGTTTHTSLIVAPEEVIQMTDLESVEQSFSDSVSVSFDEGNANAGVVTPQFRDGEGESYRFLMVPIQVQTDTQ
jgi:hypothetical protein